MGSVCSSSSHHAKQAHVSRSDRVNRTISKRQQRDSLRSPTGEEEEEDSKTAAGVGEIEDLNTAQIVAEIDDIPEGIVRSKSPRKFERYPYVEIIKKLSTRRSVLRKRAYQLLYRLPTPPEVPLVPPTLASDTAATTGPSPLKLDEGGSATTTTTTTVVPPQEIVVDTLASSDEDVSVEHTPPSEASLVGLVEKFTMVGRDPHLNARRERFNRKRHALKAQQATLKSPPPCQTEQSESTGESRYGTTTASESSSSHTAFSRSDSVVRRKTTASAAAAAILSSAKTDDIVDISRGFRAEIDRKKKERIVTFVLVDDREHAAKLQAISQRLAEKFGAMDATSINSPWMESTDAIPNASPTPGGNVPPRVLQPQHLPGLLKPEPIAIVPSRHGFTAEEEPGPENGNKHGEVKITRSQSGRIVSLTTRRTTVTFPRHSVASTAKSGDGSHHNSVTTSTSKHSIPDIKALQSSGLLSEAEMNEMFDDEKGATLPTFTTSYVESEGDSDGEGGGGDTLAAMGSPKKPGAAASLASSIMRHDSLERIRRKQDASFLSGDGMFSDKKFKDALEMSTVLQEQFSRANGGCESPIASRSPAQRSLSSSFQSSLQNMPRMFGGHHNGNGINESSFSFVSSGDAPACITAAASASTTTPEKYRLPLRIDTTTNRPPFASIRDDPLRDDPLHSGSMRSPASVSTIKDFLAYESMGIRTPSSKSFGGGGGMSEAPFISPALDSPPVNADPEALDEWHMIQHEKQNYASLVHQVLGTSASSAPSPTTASSPRLGMDLYTANDAEHDEVSDFIRSTRDAPLGVYGDGAGHGWLEEETISVNEEVINELDKMLQNTQLRHTLMNSRDDSTDGGDGGEPYHSAGGYEDDGMHQPQNTSSNINSLPIGIDGGGATFVYHFSAPPVAFLSEEMERELAQRAERRKRRAVLLRQMAAAQARLKQREIFLTNRLQKDNQ